MKLGERTAKERKLENQNPEDQTNSRIKKIFLSYVGKGQPLSV